MWLSFLIEQSRSVSMNAGSLRKEEADFIRSLVWIIVCYAKLYRVESYMLHFIVSDCAVSQISTAVSTSSMPGCYVTIFFMNNR
jgi:hypothetical protein